VRLFIAEKPSLATVLAGLSAGGWGTAPQEVAAEEPPPMSLASAILAEERAERERAAAQS